MVTPYLSCARINYTGQTRDNVDKITNTFRQKENEGTAGIEISRTWVLIPKDCQGSSRIFERRYKLYSENFKQEKITLRDIYS